MGMEYRYTGFSFSSPFFNELNTQQEQGCWNILSLFLPFRVQSQQMRADFLLKVQLEAGRRLKMIKVWQCSGTLPWALWLHLGGVMYSFSVEASFTGFQALLINPSSPGTVTRMCTLYKMMWSCSFSKSCVTFCSPSLYVTRWKRTRKTHLVRSGAPCLS